MDERDEEYLTDILASLLTPGGCLTALGLIALFLFIFLFS